MDCRVFLLSGTMKKLLPYLDDIFYWAGAGCMTAGAYALHPAAALGVFGIFCLYFAYLIGKARSKQ